MAQRYSFLAKYAYEQECPPPLPMHYSISQPQLEDERKKLVAQRIRESHPLVQHFQRLAQLQHVNAQEHGASFDLESLHVAANTSAGVRVCRRRVPAWCLVVCILLLLYANLTLRTTR